MGDIAQLERSLSNLLAQAIAEKGYALVQVKVSPGGRYVTLQIMAERKDLKPITVQDCVAISHIATARLESQKVPPETYTLEVTTPGLGRPLVRLEDFERFTGQIAVVDLQAPLDGRQRFTGKIVRITGGESEAELELNTPTGDIRVPINRIAGAHLSGPREQTKAEEKTKECKTPL